MILLCMHTVVGDNEEFTKKYNLYSKMNILNRNIGNIRVNYFSTRDNHLHGAMIRESDLFLAENDANRFANKLIRRTEQYCAGNSGLKVNYESIRRYAGHADEFSDFLSQLEDFREKIEKETSIEHVFLIFKDNEIRLLFILEGGNNKMMYHEVKSECKRFLLQFINLLECTE